MSRSLSVRLTALLVAATAAIFALLGYFNIHLHRRHLEAATLLSAERVSDVIKRSTSYYMLRNDREGLYHIIDTVADEPGMARIRIFNQEGRISFSTDPGEVDTYVDKRGEACYACHARAQPLAHLDRPDRFRIYRLPGGERALGIINPIENLPSCSSAACHAHPASQKILGVLDTNLSLSVAEASLAESSRQMLAHTLLAIAAISLLSGLLVWRLVHGPVKALKVGTERLTRGDLGHQIEVGSRSDEIGELASSFNTMSRQLGEAREESTAWARTLEERVAQKTKELKRAHEHMVQVEKMASIGRLAATVAHEINNPLSGILTYARLLRKWAESAQWGDGRREEALSSLRLIESESRRCGEIVRNLLMFARAAPLNLESVPIGAVVDRCVRLVRHRLDLAGIQLHLDMAGELPPVRCDPSQLEQVLLALVMNAIEAMPRGGNLSIRCRPVEEMGEARIEVQDDGEGIPPDVLPQLFEPFFTTKEKGHGVGLGLAISRGIVERHGGRVEVRSDLQKGTTVTVTMPVEGDAAAAPDAGAAA